MPRRKTPKIPREHARELVDLLRTADRYVRHPDVEREVGFQLAARTSMDLEETAGYLEDHVLSEEGEGVTRRDLGTIATALRNAANLLLHPSVAGHSFALPASAVAKRLREAAAKVMRY